jgi:hypothetical protein
LNHNTLIKTIMVLMAFLFQNCMIEGYEPGFQPLTDEEILLTGQIIGESLSEKQNGLLSNFSEAFAIPTQTYLIQGFALLSTGSIRNLSNYRYEFDPTSGIHRVTFSKRDENPGFTSLSDDTLQYIFWDRNQNILAFPDQQRDMIDAVDFRAFRSGEIYADAKTSFFKRTDRLLVEGLSQTSDIISIDGYHSGEGLFVRIEPNGNRLEREYILEMNFLDIRINQAIVNTNRNFRKGVFGAISYESTVTQNLNGAPETKIVNGTIELSGDGTALLRFNELFDTFRFKLQDGVVFDEDEFEGRVTQVNISENLFTMANGQRIRINDQTIIESADFLSLEEVLSAINNGSRIIAKGNYLQPNKDINLWIATLLKFELESNEFEDFVTTVDLIQNSFILVNGDQYFITDKTEVQFDDGLESLQDVKDAINRGLPVIAEGEFVIDPVTEKRNVTDVEFELEFDEFEEFVTSINLSENFFTIESGKNVKVTEHTVIEDDSDYLNLFEVQQALSNQIQVLASGKFYFDYFSGFWIAIEVEFDD